MRPDTRFTDRMLYAAACKHRFNLEFNSNFRRTGYSPWYPPNMKALMAQAFWARDWAHARNKSASEIGAFVSKIIIRWAERVHSVSRQKMNNEDAASVLEAERDIIKIMDHYHSVLDVADKVVFRKIVGKRMPVIRRLVEYRLPSYAKRKRGGVSKFTYACILDRLGWEQFEKSKEPVLTVRHFTSSNDPVAMARELHMRIDVVGKLWAASRLMRRPVRLVRFDVVRTKAPAIPRALNCRSCGGKGVHELKAEDANKDPTCKNCGGTGIGAISVGPCDTTYDIWREEVLRYPHLNLEDHMGRAGKTLDDLRRRGETFAYRIMRGYDEEHIESWLSSTYWAIREIEQARKNAVWPRNPHMCNHRIAACPYRRICALGSVNEPLLMKVEEPYPGLMDWA